LLQAFATELGAIGWMDGVKFAKMEWLAGKQQGGVYGVPGTTLGNLDFVILVLA
jgi:hypothetical protein